MEATNSLYLSPLKQKSQSVDLLLPGDCALTATSATSLPPDLLVSSRSSLQPPSDTHRAVQTHPCPELLASAAPGLYIQGVQAGR